MLQIPSAIPIHSKGPTAVTRQKAFVVHVGISALVLTLAALVPLLTWYADGRLAFTRADRLMLIVLLVDLFAGPLLTFLVYRPGKPHLRLDLTVIALIQVAFLALGLSTLWQSRPLFLVALPHQYVLIFANDIPDVTPTSGNLEAYTNLPWFGPELVGVTFPEDPEAANEVVFQAAAGRDLTTFPEYYVDYNWIKAAVLAAAKPLGELDASTLAQPIPAEWMQRPDLVWVPMTSKRGDAVQILDKNTGMPVRSFAVRPIVEESID